jgi:hypothetical protein
MEKKFKKNQPVVVKLPTGKVVEGFYLEPYGVNSHSFYVYEYDGMLGGKPHYKKVTYGVKEEFILPATDENKESNKHYESLIKRANILKERIKNDEKELESLCEITGNENNMVCTKLKAKIVRIKNRLNTINNKIEELEEE